MASTSAQSSPKGQAISLTVRVKSEGGTILQYNHSVLKQFFGNPALKDRPMVIVSIAGAMRTGKSFILNFFLRYLKNKGWENEKWMGSGDTTLSEGITWRGGADPETQGINVWNEVFIMPCPDGKEVAVVLMDTQGLFDHDTTREDNMKLFALSTLASSVQILNIKELIQERDLDNLRPCVEIAISALQKGCNNIMQLQTLTVLIRDWANEEERPYGLDGGNAYLNAILRKQSNTAELDEVRHQLAKSFSDLQCFLLSHPGLIVTKKSKFMGSNKELDEDFLLQVKELVSSILHPKNLTIKLCGGKPMTSRRLPNLLAACEQVFLDGKLPKPESLVEALAKAHYSTSYQEALEQYRTKMEDFIAGQITVTDNQLKRKHTDVFEQCMQLYDSSPKIGSDSLKTQFKKILGEGMEVFFGNLTNEVRLKQTQITFSIKNASEEAENKYKQGLSEIIGRESIPDIKLREKHNDEFERAISMFESETSKYGKAADDCKIQLKEKLNKFYKQKAEENRDKRKAEEELKNNKDELKLLHLIEELGNKFENEMNMLDMHYIDEASLNTKHTKIEGKLIKRYQEQSGGVSGDLIKDYEKKLRKKFRQKKEQSIKKNERHKKLLMDKLEDMSSTLATEYKTAMLKELAEACFEQEALQQTHERKRSAMKEKGISTLPSACTENLKKKFKESLENKVEQEFESVKMVNKKNNEEGNLRKFVAVVDVGVRLLQAVRQFM